MKLIRVFALPFFFLISVSCLFAEDFRFRVYLNEKGCDNSIIAKPELFLSETAISRREKQGIDINYSDLPFSSRILSEIKNCGVRIVTKSKWMQTVVVESSDSAVVSRIKNLPVVDSVRLVWRGDASYKLPQKANNKYPITEQRLKDFYGVGKLHIDMLNGRKLHKKGYCGEGIKIAVIDAGFKNADMMEFFDNVNIAGTFNAQNPEETVFSGDEHGTKVLSCIAANKPNYFVGTAPAAEYWLMKSEDMRSEYPIEEDYWIAAVEYADSVGVDVITSSLGYYKYDDGLGYKHEDLNGKTALISRAATIVAEKGILIFTSAGNEGGGEWEKITFPADADKVVTVGSVDSKKERSVFSSSGYSADGRIKPDVVALGTNCNVVDEDGKVRMASGTSFATPIMAGMGACLWQALPWLTSQDIVRLLHEYSSEADKPTQEKGYGIPDIYKIYKKEKKKYGSSKKYKN
ncbi:MAG: S8 family serine peptidase [Parabacteroides sp.]|nr:S8 family serine peptidase [Parabacteroides sp.]